MKTVLRNYRQSPRKVRLLADLVRGKDVRTATEILRFSGKRAGDMFIKALDSALANAKAQGKQDADLFIARIAVDKGQTLKRFMPRARGSASPIRKHSSHVVIELGARKPRAAAQKG